VIITKLVGVRVGVAVGVWVFVGVLDGVDVLVGVVGETLGNAPKPAHGLPAPSV